MWRSRPFPSLRHSPVMSGLVMAFLALVTLFAWALASAPGSAPDDNYHLSSIWCARGPTTQCASVPGDPTRMRPPNEVSGASCFSQDPDKSAACQNDYSTVLRPGGDYSVGNWNGGQYPPLFYQAMNRLITGELYSSVMLMRIVNGLIAVAMLGSLFTLLPRRLRALAVVPPLITCVPLGLSLLASTNPSAWTVTGAATLWPALYAAFETRGRRRALLLIVVALAVLLASGSRGDGALFSVVAIGLVLVIRYRQLRTNVAVVAVSLLGAAVAAAFYFSSGQSGVIVSGGFGGAPTKVLPWHQVAVANLQALPDLWTGNLGFGFMGSIGWLDTPFPAIVGFSAIVVWVALVFTAWRETFLEKLFAMAAIGSAMVVYPIVMLGISGVYVGTGFQPRYLLPLLVVFTGVSLLSRGTVRPRLARFQAVVLIGALSVAQAVALHTQIRRYVTGLDVGGFDLDRAREWWWGGPFPATLVWALGSMSFAVLTWWALRPSAFEDEASGLAVASQVRRTGHRGDLERVG